MRGQRILVVDDDDLTGAVFRDIVHDLGFEAELASDGRSFMAAYDRYAPHAVALDLFMPDIDGVELLRFLADAHCPAPVIIMSGYGKEVLTAATALGQARGLKMGGIIAKPFRMSDIGEVLEGLWDAKPETRETALVRDLRTRDLKNGLKQDEISLAYQPKIALNTGQMIGVEALARWHPVQGPVAPSAFIPLAEGGDLIDPLTDRVISTATTTWKKWQSRGLVTNVAVNVSALNLARLAFPDMVERICIESGMPCEFLTIELTESATQHVVELLDTLTRFRIKKMGVSLDDFGTGYSSLTQLHQLPFSELKIDGSFVTKATKSSNSLAIIKAAIDLAHDLGLQVIAEGVETTEVRDLLVDLGCDAAQGFLFAKPMSADELFKWAKALPGGLPAR